MDQVSSRHEGDLDGRLPSFADRREIVVRVTIDDAIAHVAAAQHTAWMCLNLLSRADGIVTDILIDAPPVEVLDRIVPIGGERVLPDRLVEAGNLIHRERVHLDNGRVVDRTIRIGTQVRSGDDLVVLGAGWWGGISVAGGPAIWSGIDTTSSVPFGPHLAACFAVGHLYLTARGIDRSSSLVYGWDCWAQSPTPVPAATPRLAADIDLSEVALAGVGAVGTSWMHAVWAYPGAHGRVDIADDDREGVDVTNLNRGVLFTRADIGRPKAHVAAEATLGPINWVPFSGRFEDSGAKPAILISAVDTNTARDSLQNLYRPRILGGSTADLRAEVLLVGEPGIGACLRCGNPLEPKLSDDEVRARALGDPDAVGRVANELDLPPTAASDWLNVPECGQIGAELTRRLRIELGDPTVPQFSVGFVSVAAGTLLAAETIRLAAGFAERSLASSAIRLQFFDPAVSPGTRLRQREAACPKCAPGSIATGMWRERYLAFGEDSDVG